LYGVGYQGLTLEEFIAGLVAMGVTRLFDVRLTPVSRKPGFSRTALARALGEAGIAYEHRRELGNPKPNRSGFAGRPPAVAAARQAYRSLLSAPPARTALAEIAEAARSEVVAVMCFEADQSHCHRDVVLRDVAEIIVSGTS